MIEGLEGLFNDPLVNMLAAENDAGLVDRLTTHSVDEFDEWLCSIEDGGSVTG